MTGFQRTIIEELILKPRTAEKLARDLSADFEDVFEAMEELALEHVAVPVDGHRLGDAFCTNCGMEHEAAQLPGICEIGLGGNCEGYLKDTCVWRYCGGPISKALEAA
jgi:hypothetical protein